MSTLVVCGSPWANIEKVIKLLGKMGVATTKDAPSGTITNIKNWHKNLFCQYESSASTIQPGKAWQQAVGDIFLANYDSPVWGWGDYRSTLLLDFWLDFDPNIKFVLLYVSPEQALLHALASISDEANFDSEKILAEWLLFSISMQQFQWQNRKYCIMVDANCALNQPSTFFDAVSDYLKIPLKNSEEIIAENDVHYNSLAMLLVQTILQNYPEVVSAAKEIEASLHVFKKTESNQLLIEPSIVQFQQYLATEEKIPQLETELIQQIEFADDRFNQIEALIQINDKQKKLAEDSENKIQRLQQGSDMLLLQIQQTQEGQEQFFIKNQALQTQLQNKVFLLEQLLSPVMINLINEGHDITAIINIEQDLPVQITDLMASIWIRRGDLHEQCNLNTRAGRLTFVVWCLLLGVNEYPELKDDLSTDFIARLRAPTKVTQHADKSGISEIMMGIWLLRDDVQQAFSLKTEQSCNQFISWFMQYCEYDIPEIYLPADWQKPYWAKIVISEQ